MTGAEHYREAERLLDLIDKLPNVPPEQQQVRATVAHTHAALAQSAALVDLVQTTRAAGERGSS